MQKYVCIADGGRIKATANGPIFPDAVVFDFPNEFDFDKQFDYRLADGALIHDPLPTPGEESEPVDIATLRVDVDYLLIAEMTREGLL